MQEVLQRRWCYFECTLLEVSDDPAHSTCEAPAQDITYMVKYYDDRDQEALLHESGRDYVIVNRIPGKSNRGNPNHQHQNSIPTYIYVGIQ